MEMSTEMMYVIDFAIVAILAVLGWFITPYIKDSPDIMWRGGMAAVGVLIGLGIAWFFHSNMTSHSELY